MHCHTTLQQLIDLLCERESSSFDQQSLRRHISACQQCRSRLDLLTDDPILSAAIDRFPTPAESPQLQDALESVASRLRDQSNLSKTDSLIGSELEDVARLVDSSTDPDILGTIGRYQIHAVLGRGGMSVVFVAWDPVLQRRVAIKVFSAVESERTWQRFAREARAAARVEHDAVVPVYEVVERRGRPPALVMPLMSGGTLQ